MLRIEASAALADDCVVVTDETTLAVYNMADPAAPVLSSEVGFTTNIATSQVHLTSVIGRVVTTSSIRRRQ